MPQKILIDLNVIAEMVKFDLSKPGVETAGLLLGRLVNGILYVEEMEVGDQQANAVHVEISDEALTQAVIRVSERTDERVIVGWWHTHPGLSSFMSSTDVSTQKRYQSLFADAVAIVIDPAKYGQTKRLADLDFGVYQARDSDYVRLEYETYFAGRSGAIKEQALATLVGGNPDLTLEQVASDPGSFVRIPPLQRVVKSRERLKILKDELPTQDFNTMDQMLDLAEVMASGSIDKIPVDVDPLNEKFERTVNLIEDKLTYIERSNRDREDRMTLFFIMLGLVVEFGIFFAIQYFL